MSRGAPLPPRMKLRLVDYETAELWCYGCQEWLPITAEFWPSRTSFWRCRACENERKRLYSIRVLLDPEGRIKNINKSRRYRAYLRDEAPELLPAYDAERREEANLAARRRRKGTLTSDDKLAYKREWMRQKRARQREEQAA